MTKVAFSDRAQPDFYVPRSFGKWSLRMEDLPPDTAQWYKLDVPKAKQLIDSAGASNLSLKLLGPSPLPPTGEANWFRKMREMVYNFLKVLPWQTNLVLIDYTKDWVGGGKGVRYGSFLHRTTRWFGLGSRDGRTWTNISLAGMAEPAQPISLI